MKSGIVESNNPRLLPKRSAYPACPYQKFLVLTTTRRTPKPVHNLCTFCFNTHNETLLSMCDSCTGITLSTSFYRRCTSSSPWIHIYYLRTCISLSKPDNANHELLIAIVHPLQVRTWCCISYLTPMSRMIVLLLLYYLNREAQVLPTKVTSYCEPHKQSTHYSSSAYLLNFISGIPSEGNAPPLSVCKTDLLPLQHKGYSYPSCHRFRIGYLIV